MKNGLSKKIRILFSVGCFIILVFYLVTIINLFVPINNIGTPQNRVSFDQYTSSLITLASNQQRADSLFTFAKHKFKFSLRSYTFIENPISYIVNFFKPGISQVTDSKLLFERSEHAFCGQKSKFMADVATKLKIPFRYVLFKHHVCIELYYNNGWRYYDPVGLYFFKENNFNSERQSFTQLLLLGNIITQKNVNKSELTNVYYSQPNNNFFYKIELFNKVCLYMWWMIVPLMFFIICFFKIKNKK